jgi:hypothetical protein
MSDPLSLGAQRMLNDGSVSPETVEKINAIKCAAAALIDLIDSAVGDEFNSEVARLRALALTNIEEGSMWAVKAVTR